MQEFGIALSCISYCWCSITRCWRQCEQSLDECRSNGSRRFSRKSMSTYNLRRRWSTAGRKKRRVPSFWCRLGQRSTNRHALQLLVKPHQTDDTSEVNYDDMHDQSPSDIEIEDNFKLELNLRARIELLEKPGRRFCKRCLSMKVLHLFDIASKDPSLSSVLGLLAQDGSSLSICE